MGICYAIRYFQAAMLQLFDVIYINVNNYTIKIKKLEVS